MRCKKNIILNLQNITSHFTGKAKIITLSLVIIMLSFANIINTSALSYQSNVGIDFTFNPTLSINISPSDLIIDNLTPGTNSDSNVINVSVATNASHGYTLAATVGNSLHNNTNLTHANNTDIFSSIATDSNLPNLTTDNTWGYSYRLSSNNNTSNSSDNNNTWSSYSGLSNETSKILISTDNQLAKPIDFKIAAKASNTQPSGTYTNTINFIAISKPIPKTIEDIVYMQTFGELLPTDLQSVKDSMAEEHTYPLKDDRDEQDYTIAKLKDGKIWMTKNLNLAGGITLSPDNTDFETSYILPTTNGWTTTDNNSKLVMPTSSKSGFSTDNYAYVYNSNNNTDYCSNPGCYSYYSWDTATLGSGRNISSNTNAPYSICPNGWKLPSTAMNTNSSADFRALLIAYGGSDTIQDYNNNTSPTGSKLYSLIGPDTIANLLLTGFYENNSLTHGNRFGFYWSSTSGNTSDYARILYFDQIFMNSAYRYARHFGFSIRCLAR